MRSATTNGRGSRRATRPRGLEEPPRAPTATRAAPAREPWAGRPAPRRLTALGRVAGVMGLSALSLAACGPPFEPGSDLPAESPPAVLSAPSPAEPEAPPAAADLDPSAPLDGIYVIDSRLQSPLGDVIDARFEAHLTQTGVIGQGATLMVELRDPAEADLPGPRFAAPVPLGADGAFAGTVPGMVVSPRFSDLLAAPAAAEVSLDGAPRAPDCLAGRLDLALIDAQVTVIDGPISLSLEGRFTAERVPGACGGQ